MSKLKVSPPFTLKINRDTLSSASVWDSTGWFMGWIGIKTIKHKYLRRLFWNQISARLSLSDPLIESLTYSSSGDFDCELSEKLKILEIVEKYQLTSEQLESLCSKSKVDFSSFLLG